MIRRVACAVLSAALASVAVAAGEEGPSPGEGRLSLEPAEVTVGDPVEARLRIVLETGDRLRTEPLAPRLGDWEVVTERWADPEVDGSTTAWTWLGTIVAFHPGERKFPELALEFENAAGGVGRLTVGSEFVTVRSVLESEAAGNKAGGEISDLKRPAAIPPDYRTLWTAAGVLALLLGASAVLWLLQRRYADRLAAAEVPEDPFHRVSPHLWVYAELQRLLEQRLPEQGRVDEFYGELARVVKTYLGGRFRVDLLEKTTAETPGVLGQAGADEAVVTAGKSLLEVCDEVKFAGRRPGESGWREAIESVYGIVDSTKPAADGPAADPARGTA